MYDLLIIGSGPSGLAAAHSAKRHGLRFVVLEKGVLANTVSNYPLAKPLFSTSDEVELVLNALPRDFKPTREQVLTHYAQFVDHEGLQVRTGVEVRRIVAVDDGFTIQTDGGEYHARTVLAAIGGFGKQRLLGVPGENADRVFYRFVEAAPYRGRKVLVVGGGNSAAEASLFLAHDGAAVTLSFRRAALDLSEEVPDTNPLTKGGARIKPWVLEPLGQEIAAGRVRLLPGSEVLEIRPRTAVIKAADGTVEVDCDAVFALIGADPDTGLLEQAGAEIADDGRPVYDAETYETTVPGLYVSGHVTREMHMKNATRIAREIADRIAVAVQRKSTA